MKEIKHIFIICLLFMITVLAGCSKKDISDTAKILPPKNYNMPLDGVWVIDNYYNPASTSLDDKKARENLGKIVSFSNHKVVLYKDLCEAPKYKIKTVNANQYFLGNYSINPESIGIEEDNVQIITISNNENYFASFVVLEEDKIMTYSDGVFLHMTKNPQLTSADTNLNEVLSKEENKDNTSRIYSKIIKDDDKALYNYEFLEQFNSGILLGLKSYKTVSYNLPYSFSYDPVEEPIYRTLWINFNGDSVASARELPFILAPRQNGFWKIDTHRDVTKSYVKDFITASPLEKSTELNSESHPIPREEDFHSLVDINFVGSNYLSFELSGGGYRKGSQYPYKYDLLKTQPFDTFDAEFTSSISIEKIMGEEGIKALKEGAATYLNLLNYEEKQRLETIPRNNNFGLSRENGKWILKGRLNYSSDAYKGNYGDYNIPIIPSKELVTYDSLYPAWNVIKERVPNALDAFSPPNKNFVIVITKENILVYDIVNENLGKEALKTIPLKNKESVIMSHWATGKYVDLWDDQVINLSKK